MWTGNVSPVMRQKAKNSRPKRNAARRAARRLVLPGFPVSPRPFSKAEIDEYLSGDKIQCLICGKMYKSFQNHLSVHSLTVDDYKEMYGLPWSKGLTGTESNAVRAAVIKRRMDEGWNPSSNIEILRNCATKQRFQPFRAEVSRANVAHSPDPTPFPEELYYEILQRMETQDKSLAEVCEDEDVPSLTWFRQHRLNPEKRRLYDITMTKLSFATLARAKSLMSDLRFRQVIRQMRPASDHVIGRELGVSAILINRTRKRYGIK